MRFQFEFHRSNLHRRTVMRSVCSRMALYSSDKKLRSSSCILISLKEGHCEQALDRDRSRAYLQGECSCIRVEEEEGEEVEEEEEKEEKEEEEEEIQRQTSACLNDLLALSPSMSAAWPVRLSWYRSFGCTRLQKCGTVASSEL